MKTLTLILAMQASVCFAQKFDDKYLEYKRECTNNKAHVVLWTGAISYGSYVTGRDKALFKDPFYIVSGITGAVAGYFLVDFIQDKIQQKKIRKAIEKNRIKKLLYDEKGIRIYGIEKLSLPR